MTVTLRVLLAGLALAGSWCLAATPCLADPGDDPYTWLEDVTGDRSMEWVRSRNAETVAELSGNGRVAELEPAIVRVLESDARIPTIEKRGRYVYNLWQDAKNPRGVWRRTTLAEYRKRNPRWEVVLDVDALGAAEKASWVFKGAQCLPPEYRRCLVSLSRGGADAVEVREFDLGSKSFVEGGFRLPEAKSSVSWIDRDAIFVATDFGPGSMTTSGYPRIAKAWKRGTPLASATTVIEGRPEDMSVGAYRDATPGFERDVVVRLRSYFAREVFLLETGGALRRIEVPADAETSLFREWLLVKPRTPWTVGTRTYAAGSLLAARLDRFLAGERDLLAVFEPTPTAALQSIERTRRHLVLNVLEDVKSRLWVATPGRRGWSKVPLAGAPAFGTVKAAAVDSRSSDEIFLTTADFLTPPTLSLVRVGRSPRVLKSSPALFDASGLEITQHFARSADGTRVPYFQVARKGLAADGSHPTLLSGYGGFAVPRLPRYDPVVGVSWLARGGVYVVANIRGGGEYGPAWHRAALRENRIRAYEDFAAVARDLVERRVTSVKRLGIEGGSNGGLLVGNMLTLFPDAAGAIVCSAPLLDMRRYTKLLAGASWIDEYGDPDKPEDWAFLRRFSPYHNVRRDGTYPPILFMATTRDDRVHPGHARKMVARMKEYGLDARYFENVEGGHGSGADSRQSARFLALKYAFLLGTLAVR